MKFDLSPKVNKNNITKEVVLVDVTYHERHYLPALNALIANIDGANNFTFITPKITGKFNPKDFKYVISSNYTTLKSHVNCARDVSINNFAGSIIDNILFINPLQQLRTVSTNIFLTTRFIKKLLFPESFYNTGKFTYMSVNSSTSHAELSLVEDFLNSCWITAWDIETKKSNMEISMCGVSGMNDKGEIKTFVFIFNTYINILSLRSIAKNKSIKVFQNGRFDNSYLLRYNIVIHNYLLDTLCMFHSWYSELPKRLDFLAVFALRDVAFWKDESDTDMVQYNARDAWATLHIALSLANEMPSWAMDNYKITFPKFFPCLMMGLQGLKIDKDILDTVIEAEEIKRDKAHESLKVITGEKYFNPGSPTQVLKLFHILGATSIESSDDAATDAFAFLSPLNDIIAGHVKTYRQAAKLLTSYCYKAFLNGRVNYALNPCGTETGRWACKDSDFSYDISAAGNKPSWIHYGFQVQNCPESIKVALVADTDFEIFESDARQAESRTTGYLSQDLTLIDRVENSPDFHSSNASAFFGIPFEEIYDVKTDKVINKALRTLAKPVNHGANYNMGSSVLIVTMGAKALYTARRLLALPGDLTLKGIAQNLLNSFCTAYPRLKGINYSKLSHTRGVEYLFKEDTYYGEIILQVRKANKLVSPLGWTRYCFDDPLASKPALNKYIAHPSQNLSVQIIDRALMRIYNDKILRMAMGKNFRLNAQVHDSILYQIRKGAAYEYIRTRVKSLLEEEIVVKGRVMLIPFDTTKGKSSWK